MSVDAAAVSVGDWPANVVLRLQMAASPVKEIGVVLELYSKALKRAGKEPRIRQVGGVMELFVVEETPLGVEKEGDFV